MLAARGAQRPERVRGYGVDSGPLTPETFSLAPATPTEKPDVASVPAVTPSSEPKPRTSEPLSPRRFLESAILFLAAVLVLRAIALEPFGVPTGSMAQTLAGNHKAC